MRTLTRRSFLSVAATLPLSPEAPEPYPYLREIMDHLEREPIREVTLYKGRSVGPTTAVLENVIGYALGSPELNMFVGEMEALAALGQLAALMRRQARVRPDLVVIDGIGYGKDDPLPPPFGSGA